MDAVPGEAKEAQGPTSDSAGGGSGGFFGQYDYKFLCLPPNPCSGDRKAPPFYYHEEPIAPFIAIVMGLQHALAMVGGIVTPPLLLAGPFNANLGDAQQQYLVAASLIMSGVTSLMQVARLRIPATDYYVGTGLISVMGTSFQFLPISLEAINQMTTQDGLTGEEAYGKVLGTLIICALVEVALSFMGPTALRKLFPPLITGVTVFLIGAALIGTGIRYWGGGVFCADNAGADPPILCSGNGDVLLPYGSPEYVGLGFSVFAMLIAIDMFGSPFMRNTNVIIALLFGYMVAALTNHNGLDYVNTDKIDSAESITFLWVYTYPLGVYGPLFLPAVLGFMITAVETIGDVTASVEASRLDVAAPDAFKRVQGGLLGDALASFFAGLGTTLPNTTYSQNNGVIVLTRCASRRAGYAAALWLILFGVLAKVAAFFTSIPDCVLGGVTTFLFANVAVSGIRVLSMVDLNRRNRFILACSLGLGLGVTIVPAWATNALWDCEDCGEGLKSFRDGVLLVLSTGYSLGCVTALLLNLILPVQAADEEGDGHDQPFLKGEEADQKALGAGAGPGDGGADPEMGESEARDPGAQAVSA